MSEFTAEAKGTAKQVGSVLKGRMGIYATLAKEHGEVSSLLNQAIDATSTEKRRPLVEKIRVELLSHARAEEATLYDALARFDTTQQLSQQSRRQHEEIEALLRDALGSLSKDSLLGLRSVVERHVEEEESQVFVQADRLLSGEQVRELEDRFDDLKKLEKQRLEGNGAGWAQGPIS